MILTDIIKNLMRIFYLKRLKRQYQRNVHIVTFVIGLNNANLNGRTKDILIKF